MLRARRADRARRSLRFERLEDRRLLALTDFATITGLVYRDATGDGFTAGEQVAGATVQLYRDANPNLTLDAGDGAAVKTATTDANGRFRFERLTAGNYFVEQPVQSPGGVNLTRQVSPLVAIDSTQAQGITVESIDTFTTPQTVMAPFPLGTTANSSVAAPQALGKERDMIGSLSAGATGDSVALESGNGRLTFNPTFGAAGTYTVVWDGPDGRGDVLDPVGLRTNGQGADLTHGGSATAFHLTIGVARPNGVATLRVYTDANNWSRAVVPLTDTSGQADAEYLIEMAKDFTVGAGSGATFTNVGAVVFEVVANSTAMDGQMTVIATAGPGTDTVNFDNIPPADLGLTGSVSKSNPSVGESVTFTLTLTNAGPSTATGVTVGDSLPSGITFVSATASAGTYSSATGVWTVGSLASGGTVTLQLTGTVASAGAKTNTAQVTASQQSDPDSTPNNNNAAEDDQTSVTVTPPAADLALTQTVNNSRPNVRSNVVFTLTLANQGPDGTADVTVRDVLPVGLTFVSATPSQGTYANGTGVWTVGAVSAGGSATLQLTASATAAGAKVNTAEITASSQPDPDSTPNNNSASEDDQASVTITPLAADLSLTKTTDTPTPNVGANVTFIVTLTNSGPDAATNVAVTDQLPAGLRLVRATPAQGTYNGSTGVWSVGTVTANSSATLQVVVTVTQQGAQANAAQVTASDQFDPDSTPNNSLANEDDQASVGVTPQLADLSLTQSVDNSTPNVGQTVAVTLTLNNSGPVAATNVQVRDTLPTGLAFVSATPTTGTYDAGTGVWTIGQLASGVSATLQLSATATAAGTKTNTAQVIASDQFDPDSTPNNSLANEDDQATATITVPSADLSLTQTVDTTTPNVGRDVRFTLKVANAGPDGATNIAVHDVLPTGLTFVSAVAAQGSYSSATGVWDVGALAKGGQATLQIVAIVQDDAAMTNTAEVSAASQWDPNSTPNNNNAKENDQASVTITPQVADLTLTQTLDFGAPNVGQNVTFTTTVRNVGPSAASNVKAAAALPTGVTFVSATPSQGQYDRTTGQWTIGGVAKGAATTLKVVGKVSQLALEVQPAQITASDQYDPNSTPNNNVATEDDQATVTIQPQSADLSLTQAVDKTAPNVGEQVTFTLTLNNAGPDAGTNVTVSDVLPTGFTFASATPSQGIYTPSTGQWNVGTLTANANATLALSATVTAIGQKQNIAEVAKSDQFDPDSTPGNHVAEEDDQASATVKPTAVDLSLTQEVDNAQANVGQQVVFSLTLKNAGPDAATGVVVADSLPRGLTFVRATPSQGTYSSTTGEWAVGGMAANAGAVLQLVASVDEPGAKTNTAEVSQADQGDVNSTPDNNVATENDQASATVTPAVADLSVTHKVSNAAPNINDKITFTITLSNAGPDAATAVTVIEALPASLTFESATPSQGSYAQGSGVWTVGTVASAASVTLQVVASATGPDIAQAVAQVATVDQFDPDSQPANSVATEDDQAAVEIVPQVIDLAIDKSGLPTTVIAGHSLTYRIVVTNTGRSDASGVKVTDTLPEQVTFSSVTASQGTAAFADGKVTADLGNLAANATATLTIIVDVAAGTQGKLQNQVTVTGDQFDTNTANNTAKVSTTARLPPARITGKVYLDMNGNGVQDGVEPPIAGVQVKLTGTDAEGNAIQMVAITDQGGVYDFQDLNPGEYTVIETQPTLFSSGQATAGDEKLGRVVNNDQFFFTLGSNDHATNYLFGEGFPFLSRRRYLASSGNS
jgi:uncharacterized repeat protein (TIGR01451 family)